MDSQLFIPDGAEPNWWASPAIFVTAPDAQSAMAPAVIPVVGQSYSVWAQVFNNGSTPLQEPRVDFFWAPPSTQIPIASATIIGVGESVLTLAPGEFTYIQCLDAWQPTSIGHQCLIALAFDPGDMTGTGRQAIFESGIFDPEKNPEVAQKNVTVFPGTGFHHLEVAVSGLRDIDKSVVIEAHAGGILDAVSLNRLGLRGLSPGRAEHVEVAISNEPHKRADEIPSGMRSLSIKVQRGTTNLVHTAVRAPRLGANEYQLVRIIERMGDRVIGGIGYVVASDIKSR